MSEQIGLWRATYTPGQWAVLGGPTSLVILRPAEPRFSTMINEFWDVVVQADSLDDLVRRLAQYNVDRMPDFAAFFWHEGEMRSLVRGAPQVVDLDSGDTVATGAGARTWSESGLGDVRRVRVVMEPDVDPESQLRLPLVIGAVSAAAVDLDAEATVSSPQRWTPAGVADAPRDERPAEIEEHPGEEHPAQIEEDPGLIRQSSEDRVEHLFGPPRTDSADQAESPEREGDSQSGSWGPGAAGAGGFGPGVGAGAAAAAGAAAGAAGAAFGAPSSAGSAPAPPLNPFGQPQGQAPFGPGPGGYPPPGWGPDQQGPPGPRQGDQQFPPTEAFTPGFAPPQHPGGPPRQGLPPQGFPPQQPYGGPPQPPAYGQGVPGPGTQGTQGGPGGPVGQGGPGQRPPATDRGRDEPSGEMVLAVGCPQGHANPPEAQRCRRCGGPLQGQPRMVPRPVMALLRPSTGAPVEVDRGVLIGRSPQANRVARDKLPKLLTVPSPSHDISRTHVQVSPEGWDLVATDLHSTNGTLLIRPGHPEPERMAPGEPMQVYPGCVLDLGDGVTILIDHPA